MKNLDLALMRRLLKSLFGCMGVKEGSLLRQGATREADLSFHLFAEFLIEVQEFRVAVSEVSVCCVVFMHKVTDLRHALKIHRRCQPRSKKEDKEFSAEILGLLTRTFPQFSDWKELVKDREHDDVEKVIQEFQETFDGSATTTDVKPFVSAFIFPPPCLLYFFLTYSTLL